MIYTLSVDMIEDVHLTLVTNVYWSGLQSKLNPENAWDKAGKHPGLDASPL